MLKDDVGIPVIHPRYEVASNRTNSSVNPIEALASYHWNAISNLMYEMKTGSHVYVPLREQQLLPMPEDTATNLLP